MRAQETVQWANPRTRRLASDEMRGNQPGPDFKWDIAGGHPHDEIKCRISAEVVPVAVDPEH